MTHPVQQRASPLLEYFREAEFSEQRLQHVEAIAEGRFSFLLRYLIRLCHREGHLDDVRWTIDFYDKIQRRREKQETQNTWARISRLATPKEIARGVEVDADGRVVHGFDRNETFEEARKREKTLASKGHRPSAYRTNPTSRGVRAFSTGPRCADALDQARDERSLIRKTFGHRKATDFQATGALPTQRRRKDDTLTDEEYRKWIQNPRKPSNSTTLSGFSLTSCESKTIEAQLPKHLRQEPLKAFTDDTHALDLALTRQCIQLYVYRLMERTLGREALRMRLWDQGLDKGEFRACLSNDHAGAKALSWFLNSANHDRIETTYDPKLIQAIAFCLVGEGKNDIWWDMLKIQHAPKPSISESAISDARYRSTRWMNTWLVAVLEAQTFWANEQSAYNERLVTFNEVTRFNVERPHGSRIAVTGAYGWLMARLPFATKVT